MTASSKITTRVNSLRHFHFGDREIVLGAGLFGLLVALWQLSVPNIPNFYDAGVFVAAAIHFTNGTLPYRDFLFPQPPGIVLLFSPIGLVSRYVGTHDGFELARVLSCVAMGINAGLLALLVRRRGHLAMLIAGIGLSALRVIYFVGSAPNLEPWCVLFLLWGSVVIVGGVERGEERSTRSLWWGGALFGVAALVELWAIFAIVAMVLCLATYHRRQVLSFVVALIAGFAVPSLPFFIGAPRNFVSQIFVQQLGHKFIETDGAGIWWRLDSMLGFSSSEVTASVDRTRILVAMGALVLVIALGYYWHRRDRQPVEQFLLLASVLAIAGLLAAPNYYNHYSYVVDPFLLGLLATSVTGVAERLRNWRGLRWSSSEMRRVIMVVSSAVGIVLALGLVLNGTTFYSKFAFTFSASSSASPALATLIPAGACVLYNDVALGVWQGRLESSSPQCPDVVDPVSMWNEWGYGSVKAAPAFVAEWRSYFGDARYVVLKGRTSSDAIPWTHALTAWFQQNFHVVLDANDITVYERDRSP